MSDAISDPTRGLGAALKPTLNECSKDECSPVDRAPSPILDCQWDDNVVHNPLGAGSYIFQKSFLTSTLRYVGAIPPASNKPKSIIIHIGAQPNNSPHAGTMIVFALAFLVAQGLKREYYAFCHKANPSVIIEPLDVRISLDLVDTAPDSSKTIVVDGITYQQSHRATGAMDEFLPDYHELLDRLSRFISEDIPVQFTNQADLLSLPTIPRVLDAIIHDHERLGWELSPDRGKLGLRSACPEPGCSLADKHGIRTKFCINGAAVIEAGGETRKRDRLDEEEDIARITHIPQSHSQPELSGKHAKRKLDDGELRIGGAVDPVVWVDRLGLLQELHQESSPTFQTKIIFQCPHHGPYIRSLSSTEDIKLLEFNTPLRNLVRTLANGLDTISSRHTTVERLHIRVTGADYSGGYQEQLLYRQLMILPLALPPPVIIYAPLVLDWAGSKLSKSLYVRDGAYDYLRKLGRDYLLSYARMKEIGKDPMVLAKEVERWVNEPKKLFRHYTIEYLHRVFEDEARSRNDEKDRAERSSSLDILGI